MKRSEIQRKLTALFSLCDAPDEVCEPWRDGISAELTRLWAIEDAVVDSNKQFIVCYKFKECPWYIAAVEKAVSDATD